MKAPYFISASSTRLFLTFFASGSAAIFSRREKPQATQESTRNALYQSSTEFLGTKCRAHQRLAGKSSSFSPN